MQAILGFHDFLKSKALGNVFRSRGLFLGAWLWYVFNTQPLAQMHMSSKVMSNV